jgi:hypothetical protein
MGRAKRLEAGSHDAGLAIEYVRSRKIVRLLGWSYGERMAPVEIPVGQLCQRLGIDLRDLGAPSRYLLFAGSHRRPAGGLRDLVGTFESEASAWEAFRALHRDHPSTQGWAELAALDGLGQVNQLAWFGLHPAAEAGGGRNDGDGDGVADTDAPGGEHPGPPVSAADRKRSLRRLIGAGPPPAYLRAVTPS